MGRQSGATEVGEDKKRKPGLLAVKSSRRASVAGRMRHIAWTVSSLKPGVSSQGLFSACFARSEGCVCWSLACPYCLAFYRQMIGTEACRIRIFFAPVDEKNYRYDKAAAVPVVNYLSQ